MRCVQWLSIVVGLLVCIDVANSTTHRQTENQSKKDDPEYLKQRAKKKKQDRHKRLEKRYTEIVRIKGGKFQMGINDPSSKSGEYPPFERKVKHFFIDKYPVTNLMFRQFIAGNRDFLTHAETVGRSHVLENFLEVSVKETGRITNEHKPWILSVKGATWNRPEGGSSNTANRMEYPVVHVSHNDAIRFCKWMGKRLPTEGEWEYAARGGLKRLLYPWGDKFDRDRMNIWQGDFPHEDKMVDGYNGLSPVEAFPPQNDYGLHDMLGNVWEWTDSRYYEQGQGDGHLKYVVKGGSYLDSRTGIFNKIVRTSNRVGHTPDFTAHFLGFRCVKTIPESDMMAYESAKSTKAPTTAKFHRLAHMYDQREVRKIKEKRHQELADEMQRKIDEKTREYNQAGRRWTEEL